MKNKKFNGTYKKLNSISTLLAVAALCTALGGAALNNTAANADETTTTAAKYALTDVFASTDSNVDQKKTTIGVGEGTWSKTTALTMFNGGSVKMKSPLAYTWYENVGTAKYFTLKFAFGDLNFDALTFTFESTSAWATKDSKATNFIRFSKVDGKIYAQVNPEKDEVNKDKFVAPVAAEELGGVAANVEYTISFAQAEKNEIDEYNDGEFAVTIEGADLTKKTLGTFENIGANATKYENGEMHPLTISAETSAEAKTVVYINEVNNQAFNNVEDGKVTDNAAPILVVNEPIDGFLLGTAFSLDYEVVDVLKTKNLASPTLKYFQYNPSETTTEGKTLSTSTYFMDMVYYVDGEGNAVAKDTAGATATTVFKQKGYELVAIELKTTDGHKDFTYDFSWYANTDTDAVKKENNKDYIVVDKNEEGPKYKYIKAVETDANKKTGENQIIAETKDKYEQAKASFNEALEAAAEEVYAGSNSYIYFPSFKWLISDNNGYRNMKFTISYKTPSSSTASTSSSLSYNALKLSVAEEGTYEFKIFANDKAGNTMMYYNEDKELVSVTSNNVWDIDEIPTFDFTIANKGLKVEDPSSASKRKDSEVLNKTFSMEDIKVVGASSLKEDYVLYKMDFSKFKVTGKDLKAALSSITYEDLSDAVGGKTSTAKDGYFAFYLDTYVDLIAKKLGTTSAEDKAAIKACFTEIKEYDSRITKENAPDEWEAYNKYNWNPSAQSFKTVVAGTYVIMADFWEAELPSQRTTAYMVVNVDSEIDTISGPSEWLKNNVVSVVLFSIAGVMLVLIIILLLVKPSDETLEDIDEKIAKKGKKDEE